mgnify:FL=1
MGRWLFPPFAILQFIVAGTVAETKLGMLSGIIIGLVLLAVSVVTWRMPDHAA